MKRCPNCKIDFNIKDDYCPLCQNKLSGKNKETVFPTNIRLKTNILILRMISFISITILIISGFIELYLRENLTYTIWILAGLVTNYLVMYFILKNSQNILRFFEKYGLLLVSLTFLWYLGTKEEIIINYIIPSLCLCELLFNFVTVLIIRSNYVVNYLRLILINVLLLILPVIFVLFGFTTSNLLSYICLVFALIVSIGLLIFYYDNIKEEFRKLFNI